jgi:pantoate--beta-alanine ligase
VQTVKTLQMLRTALAQLREGSARIALVPTMGALHEGHLTLVRRARAEADHVVASIFVNPKQFGANEDLGAYPRQLAEDAALLEAEGVALLWAPGVEAMYPAGFATNISVAGVSEGLCGAARPGHFDGVATVVCKLFNQVQPDVALFGEKDFQQLAVIRAMARDLDLTRPHVDAIIGVPTVREADGLAMSSRNSRLDPADRAAAVCIAAGLRAAGQVVERGERDPQAIVAVARQDIDAEPRARIEYLDLVDPATFATIDAPLAAGEWLLVAAVWLGEVRLIDNLAVVAR